ncbi:hypothetical protein [Moraxella catarrhalis]|uniref:hypothetical protein n=1 Tax=Moraxella catarrhalis TaxID=480 RepID=UPI000EA91AD5|nr:hypothetical protein [Moraxella catarrhalis]RKM33453.1 hypothetical protein D6D62_06480 [Moraxella catarrhalis]
MAGASASSMAKKPPKRFRTFGKVVSGKTTSRFATRSEVAANKKANDSMAKALKRSIGSIKGAATKKSRSSTGQGNLF